MTGPFLEHYPGCYGCGTANDRGIGLQLTWDDGQAVGECVIPAYGEGAPDIAHGGYVAAIADEAVALVGLAAAGGPTMTARLEIDYLRPTPTKQPLLIRGRAEDVSGQRMTAVIEAFAGEDEMCFRARGRLAIVAADRWLRPLQKVYQVEPDGPDITLGLDLADVSPGQWTIRATAGGLTGRLGLEEPATVVYRGPAGIWHDLSRQRRGFDEVTACPDVHIDGDASALRRLVSRLHFAEARQ
jgi:acyl-CoA thioesterase FadM